MTNMFAITISLITSVSPVVPLHPMVSGAYIGCPNGSFSTMPGDGGPLVCVYPPTASIGFPDGGWCANGTFLTAPGDGGALVCVAGSGGGGGSPVVPATQIALGGPDAGITSSANLFYDGTYFTLSEITGGGFWTKNTGASYSDQYAFFARPGTSSIQQNVVFQAYSDNTTTFGASFGSIGHSGSWTNFAPALVIDSMPNSGGTAQDIVLLAMKSGTLGTLATSGLRVFAGTNRVGIGGVVTDNGASSLQVNGASSGSNLGALVVTDNLSTPASFGIVSSNTLGANAFTQPFLAYPQTAGAQCSSNAFYSDSAATFGVSISSNECSVGTTTYTPVAIISSKSNAGGTSQPLDFTTMTTGAGNTKTQLSDVAIRIWPETTRVGINKTTDDGNAQLQVKGTSTNDIQRWYDSSSVLQAYMDYAGDIYLPKGGSFLNTDNVNSNSVVLRALPSSGSGFNRGLDIYSDSTSVHGLALTSVDHSGWVSTFGNAELIASKSSAGTPWTLDLAAKGTGVANEVQPSDVAISIPGGTNRVLVGTTTDDGATQFQIKGTSTNDIQRWYASGGAEVSAVDQYGQLVELFNSTSSFGPQLTNANSGGSVGTDYYNDKSYLETGIGGSAFNGGTSPAAADRGYLYTNSFHGISMIMQADGGDFRWFNGLAANNEIARVESGGMIRSESNTANGFVASNRNGSGTFNQAFWGGPLTGGVVNQTQFVVLWGDGAYTKGAQFGITGSDLAESTYYPSMLLSSQSAGGAGTAIPIDFASTRTGSPSNTVVQPQDVGIRVVANSTRVVIGGLLPDAGGDDGSSALSINGNNGALTIAENVNGGVGIFNTNTNTGTGAQSYAQFTVGSGTGNVHQLFLGNLGVGNASYVPRSGRDTVISEPLGVVGGGLGLIVDNNGIPDGGSIYFFNSSATASNAEMGRIFPNGNWSLNGQGAVDDGINVLQIHGTVSHSDGRTTSQGIAYEQLSGALGMVDGGAFESWQVSSYESPTTFSPNIGPCTRLAKAGHETYVIANSVVGGTSSYTDGGILNVNVIDVSDGGANTIQTVTVPCVPTNLFTMPIALSNTDSSPAGAYVCATISNGGGCSPLPSEQITLIGTYP